MTSTYAPARALTDADLGPLADEPDAFAIRQREERNELMRIAAVSALAHSDGGRRLSNEARAWAQHWASIKPLGREMGTGEP